MSDKKALPGHGQTPANYLPAAPPAASYGGVSAAQYAMYHAQQQQQQQQQQQAAQLYAHQSPPPTYDQALSHPVVGGQPQVLGSQQAWQMYQANAAQSMFAYPAATAAAAAAAAAAQNYQLGYPAYSHIPAAYYPTLGYAYPGVQPAQLRSTVMIPNGYDPGARFDSAGQPVLPPPPPGVAPNAAQLAAMAGQTVVMSQKKGSFLAGGSDGGYTFW